ncbi:MAG TPA: hypothetical protein VLU25_05645 [Acidobacteriota bacterium]|nr:hypothetical protein [Acidobacteriota bacterium]
MDFELKKLSPKAVPKAFEKAQRYRLLNQPAQAESIARDILRIEPDHQEALVLLLLALTDQFETSSLTDRFKRAEEVVSRLSDEYRARYYQGIIYERRALAQLRKDHLPASLSGVYHWLRRAMDEFEAAEKMRPEGNDEALLRWNSCARIIRDCNLEAEEEDSFRPLLE